jgi:hypothetical protein
MKYQGFFFPFTAGAGIGLLPHRKILKNHAVFPKN